MTTVETTAAPGSALRVALRTAHSRSLADLGLNAIGRAPVSYTHLTLPTKA